MSREWVTNLAKEPNCGEKYSIQERDSVMAERECNQCFELERIVTPGRSEGIIQHHAVSKGIIQHHSNGGHNGRTGPQGQTHTEGAGQGIDRAYAREGLR